MSRKTTIWVPILALSTLVLLIVVCRGPAEPVSHGFPLSYWLAGLYKQATIVPSPSNTLLPVSHRPDFAARKAAQSAIKDMGTNALPSLTLMLRCRDSEMRKYMVSWVSGHPWLKPYLKLRPPAEEVWCRALAGIVCLGPAGQGALADIMPLVTNQTTAVKENALFTLASIGPDPELVNPIVPALLKALGDSARTVRVAAMNALAALRPTPPDAVPAIVHLADDSNDTASDAAMNWLVSQTNLVAIPLLDKKLRSKDSYVVTKAADQIGVFGAAAIASEPRLRQLLNDPMLTVRQAASNSLVAITGQPFSQLRPEEKADITFDFPGMPLEAFLSFYESIAGKKVAMAAPPKVFKTVRVRTSRALTKTEALAVFDETLKEQAGLVIVHGEDGSLSAIAQP
jgi:hypothetical protein